MKKEVLTIKEASKILGVNPETLRRWDRSGKFPAKRHPMNGYRVYSFDVLAKLKKTIEY